MAPPDGDTAAEHVMAALPSLIGWHALRYHIFKKTLKYTCAGGGAFREVTYRRKTVVADS